MTDLAVLIAGVSSSYLEISKKMLKFHYQDCDVDFAHSGEECIAKALARQYDVVLFDNDLGDREGLDIIEALKKTRCESLIILIEEGDEARAVQAIERGASDYILKVRGYLTALPFTVRSILEKNALARSASVPRTNVPQVRRKDESFILDRRGRILAANQEMQKATHFSEEELLELSFTDLLPEDREKSFYDWMALVGDNGKSGKGFHTEVVDKKGNRLYLEVTLIPVKDEHKRVVSYRGRITENRDEEEQRQVTIASSEIDQLDMLRQVSEIITGCYEEPLSVFLERFAELVCRVFRFQRSTIALLDKRKKVFVKQAMVGYSAFPIGDSERIEVAHEVIDRVFDNRYKVKVIYHNQEHRDAAESLSSKYPERRGQKRRPASEWHQRDLVLVKLANRDERTFGYVSLDRPVEGCPPQRETFHNLELFGQLLSFAIENFHQISTLEKRSRRLKQTLVTSNIFKLHLSLNDLLKEVVWSIKFSLNFNLIALGLISKRSGNLEIKAVACEDKVKLSQLYELRFPLSGLTDILRPEYHFGKSYFVPGPEAILSSFKHIYYGGELSESQNGHWPSWGLLLAPIKSKDGKIIGALMADDPADRQLPNSETVRLLEIMATQIAVAIDNRVLYIKARKESGTNKNGARAANAYRQSSSLKSRFVDRFFK